MSTDANARGRRPTLGHIRGLDGIRALSVLAIIAFHTGLSSVPGRLLRGRLLLRALGLPDHVVAGQGVGRDGDDPAPSFLGGRARRLLPALFVLVAVIGIVMAVAPRVLATPHIVGDALSTVFYFSNWYSIHGGRDLLLLVRATVAAAAHVVARDRGAVLPGLATRRVGCAQGGNSEATPALRRPARPGARVVGRWCSFPPRARSTTTRSGCRRRRLHALFAVACLGSLASALLMGLLAPDGYTTRAYYGTDTRAQALLVGAAIAIGLTLWQEGSRRRWFTRLASVLAAAGMAGTAALWATTSETSTFAFSGGFLLASLAAGAVVLGCAVAPRSLVVRLLELPPLPQWGRISYGVYLWYWPVLLVMTGQRLHWGVYPLFLARGGPHGRHRCHQLRPRGDAGPPRRVRRWRSWAAAPVGAAVAIGAVFVSTLVPVGAAELQGTRLTVAGGSATTPATATADPGDRRRHALRPPTSRPRPAVATTTKMVKVLLVGDSVAGTFGVGMAQEARQDDVEIVNEGTPGCSLSMQTQIRVLFYTVVPDAPCDVDQDPASLFDTWRSWVDAYNPDVVVYLARGETFDQVAGGAVAEPRAGRASTTTWRAGTARRWPSSGREERVSSC